MPRQPSVRWRDNARAWVSDVGERNDKGRRRPVYFREHDGRALGPRDRLRAKEALKDYLAERDRAERALDLADPTVEQLRLLYLAHCKAALGPEGYRANRNGCTNFADFAHRGRRYGDAPARDLTATDVQRWIDSLRQAGRAGTYIARQYGAVQAMLNWAANRVPNRHPERIIAANPVRGMKAEGVGGFSKVERVAKVKEAADFLRFLWRSARPGHRGRFDRNLAVMVRLLIRSGARPGEACALLWSDIEWEAGKTAAGLAYAKATIDPTRWKSGRLALTRGRPAKSRVIFLDPAIRRALLRLSRAPVHARNVFAHVSNAEGGGLSEGIEGEPWTGKSLAGKVRKVRRRAIGAGVGLVDEGPKRFVNYIHRHTYISRGLAQGVDLMRAAELTGTSERQIQNTYGHLLDGHLADAMERIAARKPKG